MNIELLEDLYIKKKISESKISEMLNIPVSTVSYYVRKYNLSQYKRWTEEDLEFLMNNFGRISLQSISENLNRSKIAIQGKAHRLGLILLETNEQLTAAQLAEAIGADRKTVAAWIKNKGLKACKRVIGDKASYWRINIEDFWKFALLNKEIIDFRKFKENSLGKEPSWVKETRMKDYKNIPKNNSKKWTKYQEALLIKYWNDRKTNEEIANLLGRSRTSVRMHAINVLKLKPKQVRLQWKPIEIEMLLDMLSKGYTHNKIAEELGRGVSSIRWKLGELKEATKDPTKVSEIAMQKFTIPLYHENGGMQVD
ncbi:hypothetical protein FC959_12290 [Clostridium botulinum]|nr:hypothetical protein [Clostridium botulinum]